MISALPDIAATLTAWDRAVFHSINGGLASSWLDTAMPLITDLGLGHVQVAAILLAAVWLGWCAGEFGSAGGCRGAARAVFARRLWVFPALAAVVVTGAVVQGPKRIHRQRPSWFYVHEHRAGRSKEIRVHTIAGRRPLRVNGFPSGHTATATALAVVLGLRLPRRRGRGVVLGAAWVLVPMIGLSRVYVADHWPLDVLGGMVVGAPVGALCARVFGVPKKESPS